ncbi:hypothetical protein P170DRAFT_431316 [Aspergillus steynii IBT 23096]|uniref:Serine protease n=1 Tax=Aspergillus steynii IBT 23096 TaxID=1392250 RepID=A0A2I2FRX4_9EURO|nr:uncharacterized protein P170DRAFT_431316 [Aspergillus steynii IBT 23096]PLB43371.1 hypothetical protein P170DRAFT_431316 [Aspergillus steynii IBT 23096]
MPEDQSFHLNPQVWDVSRRRLPEKEETGGLTKAQMRARENWVVRLKFTQDETADEKVGTGFFLNIPKAKWYIILTAGHNLIDQSGNPSKSLIIQRHNHEPMKPLDPPPFVCPSYRRGGNPDDDYGVILIPRRFQESKDPRKAPESLDADLGFGFALNLGHENLRKKKLELAGYFPREKEDGKAQKTDELEPLDISSGECLAARPGHLEYKIETAQGLSGSPVFMPYNGHEAVVAIHNNGPARPGKGSTGARLNATVLKQIFEWADLSQRRKTLRVAPEKPEKNKEPDPLYLHFTPGEEAAWVHWSEEDLNTRFDVFPAYAPTPRVAASMLHVFQLVPPPDWPESRQGRQWVLWNAMENDVVLTDTLQRFCFVELKQSKKGKMFSVVVKLNDAGREQRLSCLVMNGDDFDEEVDLNISGITFEKYTSGKPVKYNTFDWYDLPA